VKSEYADKIKCEFCVMKKADVVRFWAPLSFTWMIMALEGPILTAVVARMNDAVYNLAAYGIALAVAMLVESPVINLLSTVVALARDKAAAIALQRFMVKVNLVVTLGMLIVSIPFVFDIITYDVIALPYEVGSRMYWGIVCLIPWPAAIGLRRYYQGLLIRNSQTHLVAYGTAVRLVGMAISATTLVMMVGVAGVVIGCASLSCGVILEALATYYMARGVVRTLNAQDVTKCEPPPTTREILKFYVPLGVTSTIGFTVTPMLAFFMNRAPLPIESLAVLPVVDAFVFFFRSFGFSYQEVGIALLGKDKQNYPVVLKVAKMIGIVTTVALTVIALTPLLDVVYVGICGLTPQLASLAYIPTVLMIVLPGIAVMYSLHRSVLIAAHRTIGVTISTAIEVGGIALVMLICVMTTSWTGVVSAATAILVGRVVSNGYCSYWARRILKGRA